MVGTQDRGQEDLFVAGPLRDLVPEDHVLKRVDKVLDLSWLRDEVKDAYCEMMGRPSIDPASGPRQKRAASSSWTIIRPYFECAAAMRAAPHATGNSIPDTTGK